MVNARQMDGLVNLYIVLIYQTGVGYITIIKDLSFVRSPLPIKLVICAVVSHGDPGYYYRWSC